MLDKKKIALLNIQRCNSHGAVLLAYALEQILSSEGYVVQTLDYKYAGRLTEKKLLLRLWKKVQIKIKKQMHLTYLNKNWGGVSIKSQFDLQSRRFDKFRKIHLHLTKEITDVYDPVLTNYNVFVVGSDVVWKPEIVRCEDKEIYFLKSAPQNAIKIAYAASVGTDDAEVLKQYDAFYQKAFDSFDHISIREQSMIPFIEQYTNQKVISVIDPVFLLSAEDYRAIEMNGNQRSDGKQYVYVYLLSRNETAVKEANLIAKKRNWSVLVDLNEGPYDSGLFEVETVSAISAGPAEFLYNIRNADCVITDSFHATAFAIIFNREFWVFKRGKISVRMSDLLKRFDLYKRMYDGEINDGEIDWQSVNSKILREREKGLKYLLNAIQDKGNKKDA